MQYLNIHFTIGPDNAKKIVTWKLKNVTAHPAPETVKEALRMLAKCQWITDSKGVMLWPDVKQVSVEYISTQASEPVKFEV